MSSPSRELGSEMGFYLMETVVREHGEEVDERKLRAPSMYIFLSRIRIVLIGEAGQFCSKSERTGRRREREHVTIASVATVRRYFRACEYSGNVHANFDETHCRRQRGR